MPDDESQLDPDVARFYDLNVERFDTIERFELTHSDEYGGYGDIAYIVIELSSSKSSGMLHLHLKFSGVLNLRLIPRSGENITLNPLTISSIRTRQWEGAYYEVMEAEGESLSFLCRSFTAEINYR